MNLRNFMIFGTRKLHKVTKWDGVNFLTLCQPVTLSFDF